MAENINLVNVRAIINLVIADRLWELLLVPLTAKPLTQIVRLVAMIPAQAVIPRVTLEDVMTPVAQIAEIPVINRKTAVMTLVQADIRKQNLVNVMTQAAQDAEIPVTKQKNVNHNVMILAQAVIQKPTPEAVMIQEPPDVEIPVINLNLVALHLIVLHVPVHMKYPLMMNYPAKENILNVDAIVLP